jgi:two-component system, chemotaxis family, protein-glutamate methylesterase/glutaminase
MALAIGSSTGGPEALFQGFSQIGVNRPVPVFVMQHRPAASTPLLADHLSPITGYLCVEATDGEIAVQGRPYIAPGNRHLLVAGSQSSSVRQVSDGPQENFCRPSVDPMFRSLAKLYGSSLLAVVLTGKGEDGLNGTRAVVAHGGIVLVQDQGTSAVSVMPGAVAGEGLASRVLALKHIGHDIAALTSARAP